MLLSKVHEGKENEGSKMTEESTPHLGSKPFRNEELKFHPPLEIEIEPSMSSPTKLATFD